MNRVVRLTPAEQDAIENAWIVAPKDGPSGDDDPMYVVVERIIAARLATQEGERGGAEVAAAVEAILAEHIEPVLYDATGRGHGRTSAEVRTALRRAVIAIADPARALATHDADVLRAAAEEIGPFHGAVLVGPVGDSFCAGWDAALAAVRERADRTEAQL